MRGCEEWRAPGLTTRVMRGRAATLTIALIGGLSLDGRHGVHSPQDAWVPRRVTPSNGASLRGPEGGGKPFDMRDASSHGLKLAALLPVAAAVFGCAPLQGAQAFRSGSLALSRGDVAQAIDDLERAGDLLPNDSEVHNQLGVARAQAGQLDLAVHEFELATELDCDNRAAAENLALARARRASSSPPEVPSSSLPEAPSSSLSAGASPRLPEAPSAAGGAR